MTRTLALRGARLAAALLIAIVLTTDVMSVRVPASQQGSAPQTSESATRDAATRLADALLAASDEERERVLAGARDAWGPELTRAIYQRTVALRQAQRFDEAIAACDLLAWVAERIDQRIGLALAENGRGMIRNVHGDVLGSLPHFEQAARIAEEVADAPTLMAALTNAGKAYENLGELALSQQALRRSLALAEEARNSRMIAHGHASLGQSLTLSADYREARVHLERALALSTEQKYVIGQILAVEGLQLFHTAQGDFDRALEMAQRLRAMEGRAGSGGMNTGMVHLASGAYDRAIRDFEQAIEPLADAPLSLGPLLYRLGQASLLVGKIDDAARYAARGLDVSERAGLRVGVVNALSVIAEVRLTRRDADGALQSATRAVDMAASMGSARMELTARVIAGRAQRLLGRPDDARRSFEAAVALAEHVRGRVGGDELDRQRLFAQIVAPYQELVALHADAGQAWEALSYAERAKGRVLLDVLSTESHHDLDRRLTPAQRAEEQRLRLALAAANLALSQARERAQASAAGSAASTALRGATRPHGQATERPDPAGTGATATTSAARPNAGPNHAGAPLDARGHSRARDGDGANSIPSLPALVARVDEARRAYDAFRSALFAAHPDLQARSGDLVPLTRDDLATFLPDARTALVEFVVGDDRTHALLVYRPSAAPRPRGSDGSHPGTPVVETFAIPITRAALATQVSEYRASLATRAIGTKRSGRVLHDLLLAKVRARVGTGARLIVIPDDSLWELPFHTLVGESGRYVLEDAAVAYAPSLTTLREMTALAQRRAREPAPIEMLAIGDPSPAEGPRVPHAAREVQALASIYGPSRSRVFVGADADEARFWEQASRARRVHVAAHGVLDSRAPLHSYVALAPGQSGDDGLLEARELMRRGLRAELLVLSACETARGRAGAGEGLIGLSWAAFVAGSGSTIVSQWKVDSRSTADLMIAFHRALQQPDRTGRRPDTADALRRAALATARTPAYAHPFYWAGFVLIGDPR